jgi:hypothetical protein
MKTKFLRLISFFLLLMPLCVILLTAGCEKEEEPEVQDASGLVLFYGEPAVDGCGWMIKINHVEYSPINLESVFQTDSLEVELDFDKLNTTWNCGWREPGYRQIKITRINIKN